MVNLNVIAKQKAILNLKVAYTMIYVTPLVSIRVNRSFSNAHKVKIQRPLQIHLPKINNQLTLMPNKDQVAKLKNL